LDFLDMKHDTNLKRRDFLKVAGGSAAALSTGVWSQAAKADSTSPNEKLNVACVGVANRAAASVSAVGGENIVALCDVDKNYLDRAGAANPNARKYADYREMIEKEVGKADALIVATADHNHAPRFAASEPGCTSTARSR
jgi:hypothetical protein